MSDAFFRDLDLPQPDLHLGVGSGNHGEQTGKVLIEFEKVLIEQQPDLVIVVGDVNSILVCALAAVKLHVPVAHVESGLRSFDRKMPEEINRLLTDAVSDYLFTPSPDGDENLLKERIPKEKIFLVGDIMVDSLLYHVDKAKRRDILQRLGLTTADGLMFPGGYALMTLHRPANVDHRESFEQIIKGLIQVVPRIPVIFPIHPRTAKKVKELNLESAFEFHTSYDMKPAHYYEDGALKKKIHCLEPLGYLDFLNLVAHAKVVLTDSGGIQEETTVLNIPCITLRDTTERPITLTEGTNVLVHTDEEKIVSEIEKILDGIRPHGKWPSICWDGHTAERIVNILAEKSITCSGTN
jgi:UDP-N-acetylglucosamine 2-epimerase (non-hydrolysing)